MISARTQCADTGWYSVLVPGSQSRRQLANRESRPADVAPSSGRIGARGKPAVWVIRCATVTPCLPFAANPGTTSATTVSGDSRPSPSSAQTAEPVRALVTEKTTYREAAVA